MKRLIFVLLLVLIFTLVACDRPVDEPVATTAPVAANETPSPEPTDEPTPAPTKEPLAEGELGKPSDKSELVYEGDFTQGDLDENLLSQRGSYSVENGKLYITSSDGGESFAGWDCITPDFDCYPDDAIQWEFHLNFRSSHYHTDPMGAWYATVIGARVSNYVTAIADTDDGIWVAFNQGNKCMVYPSGSKSLGLWPSKGLSINIPEGFGEAKTIIIVDTGDSLFYYMITSENEEVLILKIDITEDEIVVFDGEGVEKKRQDNYLEMDEGYHFKIFTHMSATTVNYMAIKAY